MNNLQKQLKLFLVILISALNVSFLPTHQYDYILSEEDRELEQEETQHGPSLNSAINESPYWESFNEWKCFTTRNVEFECTELDHGQSYVPTLRISDSGHLYDFTVEDPKNLDEFQMEEVSHLNCNEVLQKWKALLEDEMAFCVYSAYLQDLPADHFEAEGVKWWSLWYISQLKSEKGYWREIGTADKS